MKTITLKVKDGAEIDSAMEEIQIAELPVANAHALNDYNGYGIRCYGDSASAVVDITKETTGPGSYRYQWDTIIGDYKIIDSIATHLTAGSYQVTVTDGNGCQDTALVTMNQPDLLVLQADTNRISCHGETDGEITSEVSGGIIPYRYEWNTGDTLSDLEDLSSRYYSLTVTNKNGCVQEEDSLYIFEPYEMLVDLSYENPYCVDSYDGWISLKVIDSLYSNIYWAHEKWEDPGYYDGKLRIEELQFGEFSYTIIDIYGCQWSKELTLTFTHTECMGDIYNIITPNGDERNDIWIISDFWEERGYLLYPMEIYDRWGRLVFRNTNGYDKKWDGTDLKGRKLPGDSYYYVIDKNNGDKPLTGVVSIAYKNGDYK